MNISYDNKRIQKTCSSIAAMQKEFGHVRAKTLNLRLSQLQKVANLESLRHDPGHWHELSQNRVGQIAANIGGQLRLILKPTDDPPPIKADGGLDWSQITAVTILEIVDYH